MQQTNTTPTFTVSYDPATPTLVVRDASGREFRTEGAEASEFLAALIAMDNE